MLVSSQMLDLVNEFSIGDRPDSDHLPLILKLYNPNTHLTYNNRIPDLDSFQHSKRLRWSPSVFEEVKQILMLPTLIDLRQKASLPSNDTGELFKQIITRIQPAVTKSKSHTNRYFPNFKPWFDKYCQAKKKQVCFQTRFTRLHFSEVAVSKLQKLKREYNLLKHKKSLYITSIWQHLGRAALQGNQGEFWNIIHNNLFNRPSLSIPPILPETWIMHFQTIFGNLSPISYTSPTRPTDCPIWAPVTGPEIDNLLASLRSGKAPGQDRIPPDLYQAFPSWWRPILATLFTKINKSGCIPSGWKTSTVVPIFKKGDPAIPTNYRPISLLDVAAKLYGRYLLNKLSEWE
ncbi:uncharacterized protein LOC133383943 isoform X2 [Rhineura floridana]|uniref:uncharacterized protein LOC133383943 isoform X2 n=1 Tax=Rhineura floridana TaxID=261503 RepID=UPI002AC800F9|nr:uncharacterized protein LOC133383943 isoform X2 [Rhineura floridana]